jgi:catechol 2,3-dioxygenase-like lactoylglutathione lyase family enzyme
MDTTPALSVSTAFPVTDMKAAVAFVTAVLGTEPTFVDGERWAQFDLNGGRLALSGTDREGAGPVAMVKVADLEAALAPLREGGFTVGEVVEGPHEARAQVAGPDGWSAVLYAPRG